MSLNRWIDREFEKERNTPTLEGALLANNLAPYVWYRLRFFTLRIGAGAVIHALEFIYLYSSIRNQSVSTILLFATVIHLLSQCWWGALEGLRSDVRRALEEGRTHRVHEVINPWTKVSLLLSFILLLLGFTVSLIIGNHYSFSMVCPEQIVMMIYLIRAAVSLPITAYHSGIYAVRRVYRPLAIVFAVDFLGIGLGILLRPLLGAWAAPLSLLLFSIVQSGLSVHFIRQMYHHVGWKVPFINWRSAMSPLKAFLEARIVLPMISGIVLSFDSLILIALTLPVAGRTNHELALFLFIAGPFLRAAHDWAMLFLPDIRKYDLSLFLFLYSRLVHAVEWAAVLVGSICWIIPAVIGLLFIGSSLTSVILVLAPFLALRSILSFRQVKAFTTYHFAGLIIGGLLFFVGALVVTLYATSDVQRMIFFTMLYVPTLAITGFPFPRFMDSRTQELDLPSGWLREFFHNQATVRGCCIELPPETPLSERRLMINFLAKSLERTGRMSSFRANYLLVFGPTATIEDKVRDTILFGAGNYRRIVWFETAEESHSFIERELAGAHNKESGPSSKDSYRNYRDICDSFQRSFPAGAVCDLHDGEYLFPDHLRSASILREAAYFAKHWEYRKNNNDHWVSALVENDAISVIFVVPDSDRQMREAAKQWAREVALINLRNTFGDSERFTETDVHHNRV